MMKGIMYMIVFRVENINYEIIGIKDKDMKYIEFSWRGKKIDIKNKEARDKLVTFELMLE